MHPTIYLDTSVVCYLTDPLSSNPITRAYRQLTQLWWHTRCVHAVTFTSEYVVSEINAGDPLRITRRLGIIENLTWFPESGRAKNISELLISGGGLTARAERSAEHIACAALHHSEILLTWNCRDIANVEKFTPLRMLMAAEDLPLPELVTPFELMEKK